METDKSIKWERVKSSRDEKKSRDIARRLARQRKYTPEETAIFTQKILDYKTRINLLMKDLVPFKQHVECGFKTIDGRDYYLVFYPETIPIEIEWGVFENWTITQVFEFLKNVKNEIDELYTVSKIRHKFHLVDKIHRNLIKLIDNSRWVNEYHSDKMFLSDGSFAWTLNPDTHAEWISNKEKMELEEKKLNEIRLHYLEKIKVNKNKSYSSLFS